MHNCISIFIFSYYSDDAKEALENVKVINGQNVELEYSLPRERPEKRKKPADAGEENGDEVDEKKSEL
jgi:hypothetical protein